ncbi:hypothetical protein ACX1N5_13285 [Acinetobacter sp. ANC 4636]
MKNEIMSKSEVNFILTLFFSLVGYSIFIFYLLAKRSKGINYFEDLYSVNRFFAYFFGFLVFIVGHKIKKDAKQGKIQFQNFLGFILAFSIGVLLSSMFFTIVL